MGEIGRRALQLRFSEDRLSVVADELTDKIGTLRWFGPSWGAPVNDPRARVDVPVGEKCERCRLTIGRDAVGITLPYSDGTHSRTLAYHLRCWFDEIGVPRDR